MFALLQYYTPTGLPGRNLEPNMCAVCGNNIIVEDNDDAIIEKTYKLTCDHVYPCVDDDEEKEDEVKMMTLIDLITDFSFALGVF